MRGVALLAGSLGLHVAALASLPAIFPAAPPTPLFVDLATLDQAATGRGGEGGAGAEAGPGGAAGRTDDATAHARRPTPAARARRAEPPPVEAPRALASLRTPAPSSPPTSAPAPTSSAPPSAALAQAPIPPPVVAPAPAPSPPPAVIPTPSVETPPARPPLATPPAAATRESGLDQALPLAGDADRPAPGGPRDAGRGTRTDAPGDGSGTVSGRGGSSLALARPGAGPGAGGSVPPEYGAYLARFRQRVEEALVYPLAARRQGRGGRVELDVLLEPSGRVTRVDVVTSSASAALDDAAVDAVKTVEAIPFPVGLPRRPLLVRIPLVFQLR